MCFCGSVFATVTRSEALLAAHPHPDRPTGAVVGIALAMAGSSSTALIRQSRRMPQVLRSSSIVRGLTASLSHAVPFLWHHCILNLGNFAGLVCERRLVRGVDAGVRGGGHGETRDIRSFRQLLFIEGKIVYDAFLSPLTTLRSPFPVCLYSFTRLHVSNRLCGCLPAHHRRVYVTCRDRGSIHGRRLCPPGSGCGG